MSRLAALFVAVGLTSACGTTTPSSTAPAECQKNADCAAGNSCQFAVYGSCGSPGSCIANPDGSACVPQTACGCDGATHAVCLVNGNATSPIASLGSCDGAVQQGFDASAGGGDANGPGAPDATDAQVAASDADDGASEDTGSDTGTAVDAADANAGSTYGSPCSTNAQCTDPVYNQCGLDDTCTKDCTHNDECPDPPTMGTCDTVIDLCN